MSGFLEKWERGEETALKWGFVLIIVLPLCTTLLEELQEPVHLSPSAGIQYSYALEKRFLDSHIAELQQFSDHMGQLARIARDDREEAMRQRLPISRCRATILVSHCHSYDLLFAPEPLPAEGTRLWFEATPLDGQR